jgi:quercetin dioxygenase-like cupin family protein
MRKLIIGILIAVVATGEVSAYEPGAVQAETLVKASISWDGNPLPAYPAEAPEISVLRIRIPAGATLPMHRHPVINAGYMVRGALTVVTEDSKTLHLKAGDALVEVVNTWHYGKNEGNEPAEIVVFYAGAAGVPLSVKKDKPN